MSFRLNQDFPGASTRPGLRRHPKLAPKTKMASEHPGNPMRGDGWGLSGTSESEVDAKQHKTPDPGAFFCCNYIY